MIHPGVMPFHATYAIRLLDVLNCLRGKGGARMRGVDPDRSFH